MNPVVVNFCLMLFWGSIALYLFVIGPLFAPDMMPAKGKSELLAMAAVALALWNLVRFASGRSARRSRELESLSYQQTRNPRPASDQPKPIVNPEFQFDDPAKSATGRDDKSGRE